MPDSLFAQQFVKQLSGQYQCDAGEARKNWRGPGAIGGREMMDEAQIFEATNALLQVLVPFRLWPALAVCAGGYWLLAARWRAPALGPLSVVILLVGYERPPAFIAALGCVVCAFYFAVRARAPRPATIAAALAIYALLHAGMAVLTFTHALDWLGLSPAYIVPTMGVTAAFTLLRLIHFCVDFDGGRAPLPSLGRFLSWCLFFPTFVNAPFVKLQAFEAQLGALPTRPTLADVRFAAWRIGNGVFKGVLIGVIYTLIVPDQVLFNPADMAWWRVALAPLAAGLLFYLGFAGYVDIGIGAARLFGVRLPENFAPARELFASTRVRDFWRGWNITTTRWLNEYVYTPLGGPRGHPVRNVLLTFVACGLWHSISLLGALWGLGMGGLLVAEHWLTRRRMRRGRAAHHARTLQPAFGWVKRGVMFALIAYVQLLLFPFAFTSDSIAGIARVLARLAGV